MAVLAHAECVNLVRAKELFGEVVQILGGALLAPHLYQRRIEEFLGECHRFPVMEKPSWIAGVVVSVAVDPGRDSAKELAYGNHRSTERLSEEVWEKMTGDVVAGKAIAFPVAQARGIIGLRFSPLGVVQEKDKRRIVYDLTFGTITEAQES